MNYTGATERDLLDEIAAADREIERQRVRRTEAYKALVELRQKNGSHATGLSQLTLPNPTIT